MATWTNIETNEKVDAIIRLTRWREHVPFVLPLTVIGALLATQHHESMLDWRLLAVVLANVLAMSAAFMMNDLADAPADALIPHKRERNVISDGQLSRKSGIVATIATIAIALLLFVLSGARPLFWGSVGLISALLYSVEPARLKSVPIIDVVLHAFGGGGIWIMIGYLVYDPNPADAWPVIVAMLTGAAYGQFYNQLDDYDLDKAAGLRTTTIVLGRQGATLVMYGFALVCIGCMVYAFVTGLFPDWLSVVGLVSGLVCALFPWKLDMRGNIATDGAVQIPILLTINLTTLLWLVWALGLITPGLPG